MIIAIDLMSLVYCLIIIPLTAFAARTGWAIGKYIEGELDLRWQEKRKKLRD